MNFIVLLAIGAIVFAIWKSNKKTQKEQIKIIPQNRCNESRFLNPNYSPNSAIPRKDFTSEIITYLKNHNEQSIIKLVENFASESEASAIVKTIYRLELHKKIEAAPDVLVELQAILIMAGKNRDWSETLRALFFHEALFVRDFTIALSEREKVLLSLRKYEQKNKEYSPFKTLIDMSIFDAGKFAPKSNPIFIWLKTLPTSTRIHFMTALSWNFGKKAPVINLIGSTDYPLRQFGIDIDESSNLLFKSPFFVRPDSFADFGRRISKEELVSMLSQEGIEFKKSASKLDLCRLADSTEALKGKFIALTEEYSAVKMNPEYKFHFEELMTFYAKMKPLCFSIEFLQFRYIPLQ